MKLVDRDRAHPILIHAMSGPRTFVPWEQSLAKQEIDWLSGPVTFLAKDMPNVASVDAMLLTICRYLQMRHGVAWWHPSRHLGGTLMEMMETVFWSNTPWFTHAVMDHAAMRLESVQWMLAPEKPIGVYDIDATILDACSEKELPSGKTEIGLLGLPCSSTMGIDLYLGLHIPQIDIRPQEDYAKI